jgi:hypothetical protein
MATVFSSRDGGGTTDVMIGGGLAPETASGNSTQHLQSTHKDAYSVAEGGRRPRPLEGGGGEGGAARAQKQQKRLQTITLER